MHIYIPTLGRANVTGTLEKLPLGLQEKTTLVVQAHEEEAYRERHSNLMVLPEHIKTIEPTREYIFKNTEHEKIIMMDDDLRFDRRISKEDWHLIPCEHGDIVDMVVAIDKKLEVYAHVGISAREGNNRKPEGGWVDNTRLMRVLGYTVSDVLVHVEFGRVEIQEDFDYALQLIKAGYSNSVLYDYAQGQAGTQTKGGCSVWRTLELHNRNVEKMAELHAPFVKVRIKKTKGGNDLSERKEVTIYWKKCWESSQNAV